MRGRVLEAGADQTGGMPFRVKDERCRGGRGGVPRGRFFERGRIGRQRFFQRLAECVRRFAQRGGTKLAEDDALIGCDTANGQ
jgi:hypothetical protein